MAAAGTGIAVRPAVPGDAAACAAVYAPYVAATAITFEEQAPGVAEMAQRIESASRAHAWLVAERHGELIGYAYGGPMNRRAAYRWSCEVSVYVAEDRRGLGAGRALYGALLPALARRGYRTAIAGMTLPNGASAALHGAMGFRPVGVYRRIGYKLGAWHDVEWLQVRLAEGADPPAEPG